MQAVKSLCQMLQLWVNQPDGHSAEALQWLSNFPAVVQGLVQVVLHASWQHHVGVCNFWSWRHCVFLTRYLLVFVPECVRWALPSL